MAYSDAVWFFILGLPIIALMDTPLTNYRGISGTVYSDHFYRSHGFYYETLFGHPVYGSLVLPGIGADHFELMRQYDKIAGFGVMLIDTPARHNRVEWHAPDGTRRIFYQLTDGDRARLRIAAKTGVEILFAAGAREVLLPSTESIGPLSTPRFRTAADAEHCNALQFESYQDDFVVIALSVDGQNGRRPLELDDQLARRVALPPESHRLRQLRFSGIVWDQPHAVDHGHGEISGPAHRRRAGPL